MKQKVIIADKSLFLCFNFTLPIRNIMVQYEYYINALAFLEDIFECALARMKF